MRKTALAMFSLTGFFLLSFQRASASDLFLRCVEMPNAAEKVKYCLSILNRVGANEVSHVYFNVSMAYRELRDIDRAIEFAEKAALASDNENPPKISDEPYPYGITYGDVLRGFYEGRSTGYETLAELEELKSLRLDVKNGDLNGATRYAQKAVWHASKAILILASNHQAYALRAQINARFCKGAEARSDVRAAISLAAKAHDLKAVDEYNGIATDNCSEDHRGLLDH